MARVVTIPIGPIFTSGSCRGIIHVIEQGDTLYLLGKRYNVSVSSIMYANPYVNVYNLQIGDELCIPTGTQARQTEERENMGRIPQEDTNRIPMENMNRMPQENTNRMPQENMNRMPQENMNRIPMEDMNRMPMEEMQGEQ